MKLRETMAAYVADKREPRRVLPANGICPATGLPHYVCHCDNHRCGDCGRRWSQRESLDNFTCQCRANRRKNRGL